MSDQPSATLAAALWPSRSNAAPMRALVLAILGSALIALSAQIRVPLAPVPVTMQTFAVLILAMAYGRRLGVATVALYLAEGALGLPVFAGGAGGIAVLFGPTGGYLAGFVVAAAIVGALAERGWGRSLTSTAFAMLLGNLAIYGPGLAVLGALIGYREAVAVGFVPFLAGDALKLALAACALPAAWRMARTK